MDTLAVRLTIPPAGVVEDFHLQVNAPCRAHKGKSRFDLNQIGFFLLIPATTYSPTQLPAQYHRLKRA